MTPNSLGSRLRSALKRNQKTPVALAKDAGTSEATISNWLNDNVQVDHVKAVQLFRIADAAGIDARELLLDDGRRLAEPYAEYASHPVQQDALTIAIQLVTEALASGKRDLPPPKQAEAIQLAYELLTEGLPRAKVLRFVHAAVA